MKNRMAMISILCLFLLLSSGTVKVSAGCGRPSCIPKEKVIASATDSDLSAQGSPGQQTLSTRSPDGALSFMLSAMRWALGFPYFL